MANYISFGSSNGPCKTATAGRAELAEETDVKGNFDPDKLLQCPFDKNHQIRACRFPYHLIKCRKNHPKLASELKTCPFNARHLVPKSELTHHTETCEDRISLDADDGGSTNGHWKSQIPVSTWVNTNTTEDWDAEADDAAPAFVWGINTMPRPKQATSSTNSGGSTFRAPNTLPWSKM
ncbi:Gametocyte-specific factor 1 [Collichthys lucidus]|uniref:Gametocyte-specific factor 1 n=1 Tax=Collichthys lucidus TaxID=240159 RepID=A0A4U5UNV4_COLLU|nr:Gametocyte-specific factor 1 [Collichthys lucidus]